MNEIPLDQSKSSRINQGDIISDVEFIERVTEKDGVIEVSKIMFPCNYSGINHAYMQDISPKTSYFFCIYG